MRKIQAINELHSSIYAALKADSGLRKYVTNIYDYLPKQVTIKINGILDSVLADELLHNSAMLNSNNDYEISFNAKEKIKLRCSVELYERYYDPAAFNSFTVVLASAEVANTFH